MRGFRAAAVLLLSALFMASSAQAAYDDVEFTELLDDGGDHPFGYHDFGKLSVGEPGDGTVVFRGTVGDIDLVPRDDATVMYFGFSTDAFILGGTFYDLVLDTRNVGEAILPDSCEKDVGANAIYCAWSYDRIRTAPGLEITKIWGFIDGCAADRDGCLPMDTAPGGIAIEDWNPSSTEFSYLVTGCTLIDRSACVAEDAGAEPLTVFTDLNAASIMQEFSNATSDDYVYNFTNDLPAAVASFDVNGTGMANATLIDANGTEMFNGTVENATLDLGNVTTGAWQLLVDFTDFNGTFAFELLEPATDDAGDAMDQDDHMDNATGNATGNETVAGGADDQESPGIALPFLALGLGAVAFVRRRF